MPEKLIINTSDSVSGIIVGGRWEAVVKLLPERGVIIITDKNVFELYGKNFPRYPVLKISPGEGSKQLKVIEQLAKKLLKYGVDRGGFILAIGGGVVCDISGFLASIYMRGIRTGYVSTSLLSQVDASTGGKNGVDLGGVKNIIGTIRQPEFVICDTTMLRTLPGDEYLSGLAELIKTGLIGDKEIIEMVENNHESVMLRERDLLSRLVARSVRFKASVVSEDEKETGLRRILNFGHTFGHAIELHENVKHGFAVTSGMALAARFSLEEGLLVRSDYDRIMNLLQKYNLLSGYRVGWIDMEQLLMHDKKKSGSDLHFVFLEGIGKPLVKKIPLRTIIDFYRSTNN